MQPTGNGTEPDRASAPAGLGGDRNPPAACRTRRTSRRAVLATGAGLLGAAMAGCVDVPGIGGDEATVDVHSLEPGAGTPAPTPDDWTADATVAAWETGHRAAALEGFAYRPEPGVAVRVQFAAPATEDHPALLRAGLYNESDRERTVALEGTSPFEPEAILSTTGNGAADGGHALRLVPYEPDDNGEAPSVERDDDGFWRVGPDPAPTLPDSVQLPPGTAVGSQFAVVGPRDATGFPLGRHEAPGEAPLGLAVWDPDRSLPWTDSRFAPGDVPSPPGAAYHEAGESIPRFLEPSTERASLPAAIDLRLHDRPPHLEAIGVPSWQLHKLVGGEWHPVLPEPTILLPGSGTSGPGPTWRFEAFGGPAGPDAGPYAAHHLGGGTYAVAATYREPLLSWEPDPSGASDADRQPDGEQRADPNGTEPADVESDVPIREVATVPPPEHRRTYSAVIELSGPPTTLEASARSTVVEDDGRRRVVARSGETVHGPTTTVGRVDDAQRRLLIEQLMNADRRRWAQPQQALRDALAAFEPGIDVVEVEGLAAPPGTVDPLQPTCVLRERFRLGEEAFECHWESGPIPHCLDPDELEPVEGSED